MYDSTHKAVRGYGLITRQAGYTENGVRKWFVKFERGERETAILETYLDLPAISPPELVAPQAIKQRILVVAGTFKGQEGVTVCPTTSKVWLPNCCMCH